MYFLIKIFMTQPANNIEKKTTFNLHMTRCIETNTEMQVKAHM